MVTALDLQSTGVNLTLTYALVHSDSRQFVHTCSSVTKQYSLVAVYRERKRQTLEEVWFVVHNTQCKPVLPAQEH